MTELNTNLEEGYEPTEEEIIWERENSICSDELARRESELNHISKDLQSIRGIRRLDSPPDKDYKRYGVGDDIIIVEDNSYHRELDFFHKHDFALGLHKNGDFETGKMKWGLNPSIEKDDLIKILINSVGGLFELEENDLKKFRSRPRAEIRYFKDMAHPEKGIVHLARESETYPVGNAEETFEQIRADKNYGRFSGLDFTWSFDYDKPCKYYADCFGLNLGEYGDHWDPSTWRIEFDFGMTLESYIIPFISELYQKTALAPSLMDSLPGYGCKMLPSGQKGE